MTAVFTRLFSFSLFAAGIVPVILIIRAVFRKLPKRARVWLWAVVALRLLLPVMIESPFGIFFKQEPVSVEQVRVWTPLLRTLVEQNVYNEYNLRNGFYIGVSDDLFTTTQIPLFRTGVKRLDDTVEKSVVQYVAPYAGETISAVWKMMPYLWLTGMTGMLVYAVVACMRNRKTVREAVPAEEYREKNIFLCEGITTAFLTGFLHPRIYLPASLSGECRQQVLIHEKMHIRRLDFLWKPLGFLLLSIYWFQPLLWVAYHFFCKDIEYACDEAVIEKMSKEERITYTETLLALSVNPKASFVSPVCFAESDVRKRLKEIVRYRKSTKLTVAICIVLFAAVLIGCMTNRRVIPEYEKLRSDRFFHRDSLYTDDKTVEEYLTSLPSDAETLMQAGVFITGKSTEPAMKQIWNEFAQKVDSGIPGLLTMASYTIEGDPIFYYIYYTGDEFYYRFDNSRDSFGTDPGIHEVVRAKYFWAETEEHNGRLWKDVMLSDKEDFGVKQYIEASLSSYVSVSQIEDFDRVYMLNYFDQQGEGYLDILWD